MTTETIILRNKISRISETFPADYARDLLADPHYGKILEEVRTDKPEILGQPLEAEEGTEEAAVETAEAPKKDKD